MNPPVVATPIAPDLVRRAHPSVRHLTAVPNPRPENEPIEQVWRRYKGTGARDARDQLIIHYTPLVDFVAAKVAAGLPNSVDAADLASYGVIGLIDAIEKFEPEREIRFETYAMGRVRGAILDELRAIDWVPRSVRARAKAAEQAIAKLANKLGRSPTDEELAIELEIAPHMVRRVLRQMSVASVLQLDDVLLARGDAITAGGIADMRDEPGAELEQAETRRLLSLSIEKLSEREKTVLALYYFEGLNLAAIAEVLSVTESRACQIRSKAVNQLRSAMERALRDPA